jgi:hypothetical protein
LIHGSIQRSKMSDSCAKEIEVQENSSAPAAKDPFTAWKPTKDKTTKELHGTCSCGKISLVVPSGTTIEVSGYCHCSSCRKMTACPFQSEFAVPFDQLSKTFPIEVNDDIGLTQITKDGPKRFFCKHCSTYLYCTLENINMLSVNHAPFNAFQEIPPTYHWNYAERVISVRDGLIKYEGFPPMYPGMPFTVLEE